MFAVGLPVGLDIFFMISSMIIAIPTGVKIFNWLATIWRGNISFDTPMLWALGFIGVFTIGGLSGIFLAAFPIDWQVTDTYFVVAHLHYVLFGGSIFGIFAGLFYWWPKMFGRILDESLGKLQFWLVFIGFNLTFFPQHMLGLLGMPRRVYTYQQHGLWEVVQHDLVDRLVRDGVRDARLRRERRQDGAQRPTRRQRPMARRHARVVHDLAAAAVELRHRPVRDERAAAARPAAPARGDERLLMGAWARLVALAAVAGTALAVVSGAAGWGTAHRLLAALALPPLAALVAIAWVNARRLLPAAVTALVLFGLAALLTGPTVHLVAASFAFAATAYAAALTFRGSVEQGPLRDYLTLTKPRIMSLLLLTGAAGVFVGAGGVPALGVFAATMVGLALACGGASALNHYLDRDIDRLMGSRTEQRPVASGRVPAERALEFGLALSACSFVLLDSLVNLPTALLALAGNLFYVLVYTRWLKRSTPQNIVIGGAAGAVPPLVGYAGAAGHLGFAALVMFVIVFVWTPPHFWALALMIKEHYARANVPMLPVARGDAETAKQIVRYTILLIAVTLAPVAIGTFGLVYGVSAFVLGALFLLFAVELRRTLDRGVAVRLFHYSLLYLALLFVAMALDTVV